MPAHFIYSHKGFKDKYNMIIVAIDIGYINIGLIRVVVDECFNMSVIDATKIDLRYIKHTAMPPADCKIPHTTETCDRVAHLLQEYAPLIDSADHLLLERQPLCGFKDVEGLIMSAHRAKTTLISPNSMHKFHGIGHFSYEQRKEQTERISHPFVGHIEEYANLERKHDIADAVCICIFFVNKLKTVHDRKMRRRIIPLDEFRL